MAEVMKFDDFKELGSDSAVKVKYSENMASKEVLINQLFSSKYFFFDWLFFCSFRPPVNTDKKAKTTLFMTVILSSSSSTPALV